MEILDFLICDDVREEVKRKFTLVGLYTDRIVFEKKAEEKLSWPRKVKLAVYSKIVINENKQANSFVVSILELNSGTDLFAQKFDFHPEHPFGKAFPYFNNHIVLALNPGDQIGLKIQIFNDETLIDECISKFRYSILEQVVAN